MKHKIIAIAIIFLALASCKKEKDLNKQPKLGPTPQVKFGKAEKFELPNGLKVIMVENHKLPKVSVSIQLDNKPYTEGDKVGTSEFMGGLLGTGTKNITKDEFIEQIDFMGASVGFSSNGASMNSLKKYFPDVIKLLADGILNPVFLQKELDKQKALTIDNLKANEKNSGNIAKRVQAALLYGKDNPYGEFITKESIEKITLKDIEDNYNTYYKPNNAYMAIVGDINPTETKKMIENLFGNWKKGDIPVSNLIKPNNVKTTEIDFVDVPSTVQSNITFVNNTDLNLGDKDYYAVMLANNILGGGMSGRLFKNLREDKAYTYGAYSGISADRYGASFSAGASVRNMVTDSAVVEIKKELTKIINEKVSEEELKLSKAIYTGSFVMSVEKPETVAGFALNIAKYNLPENYYENYLNNINAVTIDDIQKAAKKHFMVDNSRIIITGKGSEVIPNLEKTGIPIKFFDKYANPTEAIKIETVGAEITTKSIIDNYFKAIGGIDKITAIKTIVLTSEGTAQGMKLNITTKMAQPNKTISIMKSGGQVLQKQVFDGTNAYMEMQGQKMNMSKEEVETLKKETTPFSDFAYIKGTVKGIENVENKKAYVISFLDKNIYYDVDSGLKLKEETSFKDPQSGKQMTTTTLYSNYKTVKGIKFPHTITQEMGPSMQIKFDVKSYELNKNISDNDFK